MAPDDPNQLPGTERTRRHAPPAWATSREPETPFEDRPPNSGLIWANAVPQPTRPPTPRMMVQRMFGKTPRGGPDTKAAAQQLGVSQRTVQRWIHDRKAPVSAAGERLRTQYGQWQNTPAGRKSALGRKNRARLQSTRRIFYTGWLKISTDVRKRTNMQVDIRDPALMANLIAGLESADDQAAHRALEDMIGAEFGGDVAVALDNLTFG